MKEFILILGGSGVGKNHYITTNYDDAAVTIDVDDIKANLQNVENAISSLKQILEQTFKKETLLVLHPSVGKNETANINKLKLAKEYGYKTKVIFLHGTPEQGLKNIEKRVAQGGHSVPVEKIKSSYEKSHDSFLKTIKNGSDYIDEVVEKNTVSETFSKFFKKKQTLIIESGEMLDISILNIDKAKSKLIGLLNTFVTVTEKTDGVKVTIVRNNVPYSKNWKENWIVAYKGSVIHPEDFEGITSKEEQVVKSHSIGVSQFKVIFNVLKEAHSSENIKQIPLNTELFFEFLMKKPTLTREYKRYHDLILLATSPTTYKEEFGRLTTQPKSFDTTQRQQIAKSLNVSTPSILFQGKLSELIDDSSSEEVSDQLKNKFLSIESKYGGLMEGVVLEFENGDYLKILQSDQHDKATRQSIKQKYSPVDPTQYYAKIKLIAQQALEEIGEITEIRSSLKKLSNWVYTNSKNSIFENLDPNKTPTNAKDDVFLTAKMSLLRKLPGNDNALFLGRMSPLTLAHYKIIDNAIKEYDHVVVNLVKAKKNIENPFPIELQIQMLKKCFGDKIEITTSETGNLVRVLQKPSKTINVVLAGSDRFENYKQQLEHTSDVKVIEIPRVDEISGTRVRKALRFNDVEDFKANTPSQIWDMFDELREHIISIS